MLLVDGPHLSHNELGDYQAAIWGWIVGSREQRPGDKPVC